jgi:type IV pilus assembly protein PilY1
MKMRPIRGSLLNTFGGMLLSGALALGAGAAEDVDIFGGKGGDPTDPNVLIVIDSSSNWTATLSANTCNTGNMADDTKFAAEVCALRTVLGVLPERMRLGIMMFAESGLNGGYMRFAVRNMTAQNKTALADMLANWVANGAGTDNSGSNQPYGKVMFEAFKYFGGGGSSKVPQGAEGYGPIAFAGGQSNDSGTYRRDYAGNNSGNPNTATHNRAAPKYGADANNAFDSQASNTYISPLKFPCAKNFIIFISNGNPGTGGDAGTPDAATLFTNVGGSATDRVRSAGTEVHASLMDEFARHFYKNDISDEDGDQFLRTYTIAVYAPQSSGAISNTDQQMIKLMKSAANVGGGKYFAATEADDITKALLSILNEVQAVNSVFVSASLPVSVNTQGTFLNQVYMGLFRPDAGGSPRWLGNLKEFKFVQDPGTGDIYLADSAGNRAVNPATGFITPAAVSFWTSASTFWANDPKGIPPSPSDSPDGDVVEKGGTAYVQRNALLTTQTTRTLYTCPAGGCTAGALSYAFNDTNITGAAMQTAFGVGSAAELTLLVDWVRGQDNAGGATLSPLATGTAPCDPAVAGCLWVPGEQGPGWPTTARASLQGDVLHSRPVVLNYSSAQGHAVDGPYIFYGSNDGFLRAVKGGQAAGDGVEVWSFLPPEFYGKAKRLRYQEPIWLNPGTDPAAVPFAATKDYFFDGPIGAYEDPTTSPPTKWIFVTARRGGRMIYAFDVTNPNQPAFKWSKTNADLPFLGQTWSLPIAFKLTGVADPFLVFGAGYDPGEDVDPAVSNNVGRGIYVLNAATGAELRFINTSQNAGALTSPIASDMGFLAKIAASGGFGDVYRGYVGDLNGNVWRLDIPDGTPANWKLWRFATLGPGPKFLFAPDLVRAGNRDIVLIGSGDREKPLVDTSVDRFYGLADFQNATTVPGAVTPLVLGDLESLSGDAGIDPSCSSCPGWYRELAAGEKVVNSPLTVAGITFFSTNKPLPVDNTSCDTNLGEARAYGISFLTGGKPASRESISAVLTGGGLAPSPVGGVVEIEPGKLVSFVIGSGKDGSRLEPERPPLSVPTTRTKIYWNVKTDN